MTTALELCTFGIILNRLKVMLVFGRVIESSSHHMRDMIGGIPGAAGAQS